MTVSPDNGVEVPAELKHNVFVTTLQELLSKLDPLYNWGRAGHSRFTG